MEDFPNEHMYIFSLAVQEEGNLRNLDENALFWQPFQDLGKFWVDNSFLLKKSGKKSLKCPILTFKFFAL